MKVSDISEIKKIETESGLSDWNSADYVKEINSKFSFTKTTVLENKIVGFIIARLIIINLDRQIDFSEIYNIAVSKEYRKNGIGNFLIENFIKHCKKNKIQEIFLEVRKSNIIARKFYKQKDFEEIAERKNYYTTPLEDAVIMKLIL